MSNDVVVAADIPADNLSFFQKFYNLFPSLPSFRSFLDSFSTYKTRKPVVKWITAGFFIVSSIAAATGGFVAIPGFLTMLGFHLLPVTVKALCAFSTVCGILYNYCTYWSAFEVKMMNIFQCFPEDKKEYKSDNQCDKENINTLKSSIQQQINKLRAKQDEATKNSNNIANLSEYKEYLAKILGDIQNNTELNKILNESLEDTMDGLPEEVISSDQPKTLIQRLLQILAVMYYILTLVLNLMLYCVGAFVGIGLGAISTHKGWIALIGLAAVPFWLIAAISVTASLVNQLCKFALSGSYQFNITMKLFYCLQYSKRLENRKHKINTLSEERQKLDEALDTIANFDNRILIHKSFENLVKNNERELILIKDSHDTELSYILSLELAERDNCRYREILRQRDARALQNIIEDEQRCRAELEDQFIKTTTELLLPMFHNAISQCKPHECEPRTPPRLNLPSFTGSESDLDSNTTTTSSPYSAASNATWYPSTPPDHEDASAVTRNAYQAIPPRTHSAPLPS